MGLCGPTMRLPMTQLTPAYEPIVEGAMRSAGLI
jgi:4-hydroxy-tetrahydrodipicolinate synthase